MDTATLTLRPVGYRHPDAAALVARVQEEYVERYGGPDESHVDPAEFDPPGGLFLVGYLGDAPAETAVATGAWRSTDVTALGSTAVAEIKRMYVVPELRGRGLSRLVLAELERTAAAAGHEVLILETGLKQPEAIGLYTSSGYVPIEGFGHYCGHELARSFAKRLGPDG